MTDAVPPAGNDDADQAAEFSRMQAFEAFPVSQEYITATRKINSNILQRLNEVTAVVVAQRMGVHDSAVSRWKTSGQLAFVVRLLACLGLKVVPADAVVYVQPDEYK
jgi:hypothetical protein